MSLILTTGHGSCFRDAHMTQFRPTGKQETFPEGICERNLLAIQRKLLEESFFSLFLPSAHLWMHTSKHVASLDNHHVPGWSWLCWKQSQNRKKLGPRRCCKMAKSNQPRNNSYFLLQACASLEWFRPAWVDLCCLESNFHIQHFPDNLNIHMGTSPPLMAAVGCLVSYAYGNPNPDLIWFLKKIKKDYVSCAQVLWNKITSCNIQKKGNNNGKWLCKS